MKKTEEKVLRAKTTSAVAQTCVIAFSGLGWRQELKEYLRIFGWEQTYQNIKLLQVGRLPVVTLLSFMLSTATALAMAFMPLFRPYAMVLFPIILFTAQSIAVKIGIIEAAARYYKKEHKLSHRKTAEIRTANNTMLGVQLILFVTLTYLFFTGSTISALCITPFIVALCFITTFTDSLLYALGWQYIYLEEQATISMMVTVADIENVFIGGVK